MLASHGYGLNNCVTNPASAAYPSIPHLLSDYALHDLLNTLIPVRPPRPRRRGDVPDR